VTKEIRPVQPDWFFPSAPGFNLPSWGRSFPTAGGHQVSPFEDILVDEYNASLRRLCRWLALPHKPCAQIIQVRFRHVAIVLQSAHDNTRRDPLLMREGSHRGR
jgi:hypothetical protein